MTKLRDKRVLITGGASGIGRIMGRMVMEKGASKLIIWDINPQNIENTLKELAVGDKTVGYQVDVSNPDMVHQTYLRTKEECGDVDVIIQSAGIVRGNKRFDQQTTQDILLTNNINLTAPMLVALEFMPDMIARNSGHICNIASAAGMLGVPKLSVYCASKWGVIGWADSVRIELKEMKSKVRFTTIAPYFINTGMFDGVNSPIFPILEPEATSKKIIRAIEKDKNFRGIPFGYHFVRFMEGLLPLPLFDWIFGKVFGVYQVMDQFTGRK